MCLTRRDLLLAGFVGVTGTLVAGVPAGAAPTALATTRFGGVDVIPRSEWGPHLPVKGKLGPETVKFLLVHHSASPNAYAEADVVRYLSSFHTLHTAADKGWPDIAYNFFVDRFGRVFEGRTGSLNGPVEASATGGNQGFAQLVCLVGDFTKEPPSPAALTSLSAVLAALADRDGVSLDEGAEVTFVSRGSNKHKKGATVSTPTVAGHRDMSATACPGDACYTLIKTKIAPGARQAVGRRGVTDPPASQTAAAPTSPEAGMAPEQAKKAENLPVGGPDASTSVQSVGAEGLPLWPFAGAGGLSVAAAAAFILRRRIVLERAEAASFRGPSTDYEP